MTSLDSLKSSPSFKFFASFIGNLRVRNQPRRPFILLDGGLSTSHNIISNLLIGLAAHEIKNLNIAHLTGVHKTDVINFLMHDALGSTEINYTNYSRRRSVLWRYRLCKLKYLLSPKRNLLDFKIEGIQIGDLVYDTIIRFHNDVYTIDRIGRREKNYIFQAIYRFYVCKEILKDFDVKYIVVSHKFYIQFGIMPRLLLKQGGQVISANRGHLRLISSYSELFENDFVFNRSIHKQLSKLNFRQIDETIRKRFNGEILQHDVQNAYTNKRRYSYEEIVQKLNLNSKHPIAAILPHAFSDAPHCHAFMIYSDYYKWFMDTLRIISAIKNVNWLIKPHPSSSIYSEDNVVSNILKDTKQYGNIHLLPADIHTESVFKFSDALITIRGTAGLESVFYDIKPIICGDAVYSNLGITINCRTVEEYESALREIGFKKPLDETAIRDAKLCLYWWHHISLPPLGIIPNEILPNLPNDVVLAHDLKAYEGAASFLKEKSLNQDMYYGKLCEFFQLNRPRLSGIDFLNADEDHG